MAAYSLQKAEPKIEVKDKPKKSFKVTKPTISEEYLTRIGNWEDMIADEVIQENPGKDEWRKRLIRTMFMEAFKGDILEIWEFSEKYLIPPEKLSKWAKQYDDMAKAFDYFKRIIASKRRAGCMRKKLDSYSSLRDIHLLDSKDDEVNRYHLELKKLKDLEDQVRYLVEIVKPKTISAIEMQEQREINE